MAKAKASIKQATMHLTAVGPVREFILYRAQLPLATAKTIVAMEPIITIGRLIGPRCTPVSSHRCQMITAMSKAPSKDRMPPRIIIEEPDSGLLNDFLIFIAILFRPP